jgi:hypothetical protein
VQSGRGALALERFQWAVFIHPAMCEKSLERGKQLVYVLFFKVWPKIFVDTVMKPFSSFAVSVIA